MELGLDGLVGVSIWGKLASGLWLISRIRKVWGYGWVWTQCGVLDRYGLGW